MTINKRQVSETIYGKLAKQTAEQLKHSLFQADERDHQVASPWDDWTVESPDGHGWAVFVTESK